MVCGAELIVEVLVMGTVKPRFSGATTGGAHIKNMPIYQFFSAGVNVYVLLCVFWFFDFWYFALSFKIDHRGLDVMKVSSNLNHETADQFLSTTHAISTVKEQFLQKFHSNT